MWWPTMAVERARRGSKGREALPTSQSLSELRKVLGHLPLELGEIARDRRHIETSEDRFLWLAVEQEPEGRLEIALRGMLAGR